MDNITHSLIGAGLANAGLRQKFGRGTTLALMLSSNLPDIDVFWGFVHPGPSSLYRRMLTHSVLGMPILAAVGALLLSRIYRNQSWSQLFGLFFVGIFGHICFDLVNSYGVVVLYPFSRTRYELGLIFIIDLV